MDGMAEGLEEESKKSLQMEAELEKQLAHFDTERQQMRLMISRRDDRSAGAHLKKILFTNFLQNSLLCILKQVNSSILSF